MNCISPEVIQIYIDGEATTVQAAMIEKHISCCEKCSAQVLHQKRLSIGVKNALHLLTEDTILIPLMTNLPRPVNKQYTTSKRLFYAISAACLLFLVYINIHKAVPESQSKIAIVPGTEWEVDANRPLSQQQLILNIVDVEGNITEYLIN